MIDIKNIQSKFINKTSHILPIYYPVPTVTYLDNVLFCLRTLPYHAFRRFYNSFILLFWAPGSSIKFRFYPNIPYQSQTYFQTNRGILFTGMITYNKNNIIRYMKKGIKSGAYIYAYINEPILESTQLKNDQTQLHACIFYGFEGNTFKMMNFDPYLNFKIIDVPEDKLSEAFFTDIEIAVKKATGKESISSYPIFDLLYPWLEDIEKNDFLISVIANIDIYLHSITNISIKHLLSGNYPDFYNSDFGIDVYLRICENLKSELLDKIDFRIFTGIYEHKYLWVLRLKYLEDEGYLSTSGYWEKFQPIEKMANTLKLLCFKYNIVKNSLMLKRMIDLLFVIRDAEVPILKDVLEELKEFKLRKK